MQDIYNIREPFGLLDEETKVALKAHDGVIVVYDGEWKPTPVPQWISHFVYRAFPFDITKSSIKWSHVADEFICMATDSDKYGDQTWLHSRTPSRTEVCWVSKGDTAKATAFASFKPGTCAWEQSLTFRPNVWIEWKGGECPIPDAKSGAFKCKLANGEVVPEYDDWDAEFFNWHHDENGPVVENRRIVAFRLLSDEGMG